MLYENPQHLAPWSNGRTPDFQSGILGSSPDGVTRRKRSGYR